jgi:hypothetical protein
MIQSELIKLLQEIPPETNLCIEVKTNITTGSGESISFIYELEGLNTIIKIGDNAVMSLYGQHIKQALRKT